jgi:putative oxidoreductase
MKNIRDAIIIVLLASVLGIAINLVRNALSGGGLTWNTTWTDNRKISGAIDIPPSYQPGDSLLSLNDAYNLYTKNEAIFIDAREPVDYNDGHIIGAINFPFEHWDDYWAKVKPTLDPNKEIVAYCGGLDCELSLFMARQLKELGYNKSYIFFGGWLKWKESSLPTETSQPTKNESDASGTVIPIVLAAYIFIMIVKAIVLKDSLSDSKLVFLSRLILAGLFIYASYDKIFNPLSFAGIIHNYRLVGPSLINIPAIILPWIEFIAGALLIIGYKPRSADLIIGGMLIMYIFMLAITAHRGINISCGCFSTAAGVKSNLILRIIEDVGMLFVSLHILIFYKARFHSRGFVKS